MAAFHFTMHFPHTHLLSMGLNVAKCNLGEAKHETMLASSRHYLLYMGRSWALAYFTVLSLSQDFILHMLLSHAVALAPFLLPAFPSLWMFFGKYMSISPLKVSVWWCLKGATHRVVTVTFQVCLGFPSVSPGTFSTPTFMFCQSVSGTT